MRSYKDHLKSLQKTQSLSIKQKPIFRASSIFPMIQNEEITSRVLFMGYWLLKRNISQISGIYTLRSEKGDILARTHETIEDPKAHIIELGELLKLAGLDNHHPFKGSLETEFYSSIPMVFPFPATSVNYYGPNFSTVVHTAQRVYNDYDDMAANSVSSVPESGFNIFASSNKKPFFTLINGTLEVADAKLQMTFYNSENKVLNQKLKLGTLKPYETKWIFPTDHFDLQKFLNGQVGAAKICFDVPWIFPRLIVGNIQSNPQTLSITHSYYDCTKADSPNDYWKKEELDWHLATLMIPLLHDDKHFTNATFYPIYSPSNFTIDVEIYNSNGKLLGKKECAMEINAPSNEFKCIHINDLCKELSIEYHTPLTARLIAKTKKENSIPTRIKCAIDIGTKTGQFPCNICTNLQPFIPSWDNKPFTFKWCPLLAGKNGRASIWIVNSSQHKNYSRTANVDLTFYRSEDNETLQEKVTIAANGSHIIERESELDQFMNGRVGWMTATSDNPHILTYYFIENDSGVIGGDHGF